MRTKLLALAALVAVSATALQAQGGGRAGPGGRGGPGGREGGQGRGGPAAERCRTGADSLTDVQKGQVDGLAQRFHHTHAAQLDSALAIMERGRAAREAGKSMEEVRAIMESGRAIGDALAPARQEFDKEVRGFLTEQQIASGCIPPAPGGPPPGGRRGGPPPRP